MSLRESNDVNFYANSEETVNSYTDDNLIVKILLNIISYLL